MRVLHLQVSQRQAGRRLSRVILSDMGVSRHAYARLKQTGGVQVDGKLAHADARLVHGQVVTLTFFDDARTLCEPPFLCAYEDEDILVVDKPAPMATMCAKVPTGDSLQEMMQPYVGVFRPINRLDKGTSGLMLLAKTAHAQSVFQKLLHTEEFVREYLAVPLNMPMDACGVISYPIAKQSAQGVRRVIAPDGKPCRTYYRSERILNSGNVLVRVRLDTGRTHQIRVHMAAIGCPIVGDYLYGAADARLAGRFALHSAQVSFYHPILNRPLAFTSPLPPVFEEL